MALILKSFCGEFTPGTKQTAASLLSAAVLLLINPFNAGAVTPLADPDFISTGYSYSGRSELRAGDIFGYGKISAGGMVEIRNEERFNQKFLPNHNWRGYAFIYHNSYFRHYHSPVIVSAGFEHESAHPTMGLNEGSNGAYEKIYDGTWRNINLNSFKTRLSYISGPVGFTGDLQFYFNSRNTPELANNKLTWSEGVSGGIDYRYYLTPGIDLYVSLFDRYIFESRKKIVADIYLDTSSGVETRTINYPVINNVNTVTLKCGVIFHNIIPDRKLSLFIRLLYGNIYGFVDSREKRSVLSAGIEIFH